MKGVWFKRLLDELKFPMQSSIDALLDNMANSRINNLIDNGKTKHADVDIIL